MLDIRLGVFCFAALSAILRAGIELITLILLQTSQMKCKIDCEECN